MRNELVKLAGMLEEAGIPFEWAEVISANDQIVYPSKEHIVSDVVCHSVSYGHEKGLLEQMGLLPEEELKFDTVQGYLTANVVFERWKKHFEENK